jgi:putative phosphotransacetylase
MEVTAHVTISNRHMHPNREAIDVLFGKGYELKVKKVLADSIFAADETVTIKGPKGEISSVRLIGPLRDYNQVEILKSDNFILGIDAPVKISGSKGLAPLTVIGPKGRINFESIAMVALRHIHFEKKQAEEMGLENGQIVQVKVDGGNRKLIFDDVMIVYTTIDRPPMMHVDVEEANAAGIKNMDMVKIII